MAVKDFTATGTQIMDAIGGAENVSAFQHCVTRLRFELKDKDKLNEAVLKKVPGVLGLKWAGEQLQVIIGNEVSELYDKICEMTGLKPEAMVDADDGGNKVAAKIQEAQGVADRINNFMKPLINSVIPLIGVFVGSCLLKGVLAALVVFGAIASDSTTYTILYGLSDSLLYFFPIFIGFTAGKVFNTNQFMTAVIGATLCYPSIVALTGAEGPVTLFGIPLTMISYTSTILPIFAASFAASKLYAIIDKHCPKPVRYMLPVALTLVIILPLTLFIIGPVMTFVANIIGGSITAVYNVSPALATGLVGALWQMLVMTGMHSGMLPLMIQLQTTYGYDILGAAVNCSMMALAGGALAMFVFSKQDLSKQNAISSMVSTLLGVTEPAIYGVALPHPKTLGMILLSGGIGGVISSLLGVKVYSHGGSGLLQLPFTFSIEGGVMNTVLWAVCCAVAFAIAFVLCSIVGRKEFEND